MRKKQEKDSLDALMFHENLLMSHKYGNFAQNMRHLLAKTIGTGFGSGYWPWGPGTAGTVVAALIWWGLSFFVEGWVLCGVTLALIVVFTVLGTWATAQLQPEWGADPSRVVVDEMVGLWTALLIPPCFSSWLFMQSKVLLITIAVVLFRFFDIVKPLGIRAIDRKESAFCVMADDLVAGLYSLVVILLMAMI